MPSTNFLIRHLRTDYPDYTFQAGSRFVWSAEARSISYDPTDPHWPLLLLHELGHALLGHLRYRRDIELIKLERDAWEQVKSVLCARYDIPFDEATAQAHLDTYRDWLHARSTCPDCDATGLQVADTRYRCLACRHEWRVNEARLCALRRYALSAR